MNRLSVFVALALVLCFGLAYGQTEVSFESVTGEWNVDTLQAGLEHHIFMKTTNIGSYCHYNITNGFKVYSEDGAEWLLPYVDTTFDSTFNLIDVGPPPVFETVVDTFVMHSKADPALVALYDKFFINEYGVDGLLADSTAYAGVGLDKNKGIYDGWDATSFEVIIQSRIADHGKHICIDSTWTPPGGTWKWAALTPGFPDILPGWSGIKCWVIYEVPDLPPEIVNCNDLDNYEESHCEVLTRTFVAVDPDSDPANIEYELADGPGGIDPVTGVWSWNTAPQTYIGTITVHAKNTLGPNTDWGPDCEINIEATNAGPTITGGCGVNTTVQTGELKSVLLTADDDCDGKVWTVPSTGGAIGVVSVVDGLVSYTPDDADALLAQPIVFTVQVSDGLLTDDCTISWNVIAGAPYIVKIEKEEGPTGDGVPQGQFTTVDVTLEGIDINQGIGGFNLLIAYDATALSFQQAKEGQIYVDCGWEYFTYRYGPDGNCGNGCPSGLLRVVGIAETNNGPYHPGCAVPTPFVNGLPVTLTQLIFLVSNDRLYECMYVPIRFFWIECGDNTLSNFDGTELYISAKVYDFDNADPINSFAVEFPTYLGAQEECLVGDKVAPIPNVDFYNGGVDIICSVDIDARGDINANGWANEIADAVMFSNYFVNGLGAFAGHPEASIAASDVNADGLPLSIADLVYLIRVVVGDAMPYPKVNPEAATYMHNPATGVVSVDSEMGAAFFQVAGQVTPDLLAQNMEMSYRFDGTNTRILVFSTEIGETFAGGVIAVEGDIITAEMARYDGTPVSAKPVPADYSLAQNYPNPFNPTTMLAFDLKNAGEWSVTIYNVTGQVVNVLSGYDEAGTVTVEWDASSLASGIYFYKLEAGDRKSVV